jgi:HEAT repeat protein
MGASNADQDKAPRFLPDDRIRSYIEELNSKGPEAATKLISCGQRAVEPLRKFLLHGKPSVVYQPRQRAVEALASLGAKDVLVEYLNQPKEIADPAVRMAEEAVESTAARELIRWPSEEVFELLLGLAKEQCLPGVLEALGELKRLEAAPYLVKALEDDVCRRAAEDALRKIGPPSEPDLIRAAISPRPSRKAERPSSLLARRSAVRLLAEIGVSAYHWRLLGPLLKEADVEILVPTFRIAARAAGAKDRASAFLRLIRALQGADWFVKSQIENALVDLFDAIKPLVEEEIAKRGQLSDGRKLVDPVLAALFRVKRRAETRHRVE